MDLPERATRHAAMGDERRLLIVDQLVLGDKTVTELGDLVGMKGNLLAHHLDVLDEAGLVERRVSEGDQRRRYVTLRWEVLPFSVARPVSETTSVVFVCTHNSARSQFAAALWQQATGGTASSAGTEPAMRVHPQAVRAASRLGVDISRATPSGYSGLPESADLLVSVCDRANESLPRVPKTIERLHWSVPDPVPAGTLRAFRSAFEEIARRVEHVTGSATT